MSDDDLLEYLGSPEEILEDPHPLKQSTDNLENSEVSKTEFEPEISTLFTKESSDPIEEFKDYDKPPETLLPPTEEDFEIFEEIENSSKDDVYKEEKVDDSVDMGIIHPASIIPQDELPQDELPILPKIIKEKTKQEIKKRKNSIFENKPKEKFLEVEESSEESDEESENEEEENINHKAFQEWFLNVNNTDVNFNDYEEPAVYVFEKSLIIPSFPKMDNLIIYEREDIPDELLTSLLKQLYSNANFTPILNSLRGSVQKKTIFEYLDTLHGIRARLAPLLESLEDLPSNKRIEKWGQQLNVYLNKVYQSIANASTNLSLISDWEHKVRKHHKQQIDLYKKEDLSFEEDDQVLTSPEIILVFLATLLNNKKILLDDKELANIQMQVDPKFLEFFRGLSTVQKLLYIKQHDIASVFNTYIVPLFVHDTKEEIEDDVNKEKVMTGLLTFVKPSKIPPVNLLVSDFILQGDYKGDEREKIKEFLKTFYGTDDSVVEDKIYQALVKELSKDRDVLLNASLENAFTTIFLSEESAIHVKTLEQAIVQLGASRLSEKEDLDIKPKVDVECLSCSSGAQSSLQILTQMYSNHKIQHEVNAFRKDLLEKYKDRKEPVTPKIILEDIHAKAVEQKLSIETVVFLKKILEVYESLELIPRVKHDYNIQDFHTLLNLNATVHIEQKNYFVLDEVRKVKYALDSTLVPLVFKELYTKVQDILNSNKETGKGLLREFGKSLSTYKLADPLENEHIFNELREGNQASFVRSLVVLCKISKTSTINLFAPQQSKERRAKRRQDSIQPKQIIGRMLHRECVNFYDFDLVQTKPWLGYGPQNIWIDSTNNFEPSESFWKKESKKRSHKLRLLNLETGASLPLTKERTVIEDEYMKKQTPKFEVEVGSITDDITHVLKAELTKILEKIIGLLNNRAIVFEPRRKAEEIVNVFLGHYKTLSLKTMLFQFFLIYNLILVKPLFFIPFFLYKQKKLPYLKVYHIVPEILVSDQSVFESKLDLTVFEQVFSFLVNLKVVSPMYKTFLDTLYIVNTSPYIFMSSHANQYKNFCENFDTLEGPLVFYYTNQDTEELHGAGFAELNDILNNQETLTICKHAVEAVQSLVIPEQTQSGDIFIAQTELLRQLSSKLDSPSPALIVDCLREAANMYEESEKLSPIRKILKDLELTTYPIRGLAKEHITTQVLKTFWDKVFHTVNELPQTWTKWKSFVSEFVIEEMRRRRVSQIRADRKTRIAVIKKFGLLQHLPLRNIDSTLVLSNLVDYLTLLLVPEASNAFEHNCELCNKKISMKTYINRPNGFEEVWVCNNEQCFQATLSEDKLPPLSSAHIANGEIRSNINQLFEPFMTSEELHHTSWKELVFSFDIKGFSDAFIKARAPYIYQLYKRFVLDDHPDKEDVSPREELKELFNLEAFKKAVRNSFVDIVSVDIMSLVKDLLIPPSTFKSTSDLLPIQEYHGLISTQKKWGSSWLPEEIIKERSKLIQDVYDYFIDGKAETDSHKQVNALFENEKFKEALTNVLVLAPS